MYNGVINVYKEPGYTSHDVVARLRGITKQKKIGHTGTLDPDSEGVLPVCLGAATRICDMLTDEVKEYEADALDKVTIKPTPRSDSFIWVLGVPLKENTSENIVYIVTIEGESHDVFIYLYYSRK